MIASGFPGRPLKNMANAFKNMAFIWQKRFENMAFIWHPFFHVKQQNKIFIYSSDTCQILLRIGENHFGKENRKIELIPMWELILMKTNASRNIF
jgi:hypothetical protein